MSTDVATAPAPPAQAGRPNTLAGTGVLLRFLLRRDRIKLPAWAFGIAVFTLYYAAALPQLFPTEQDLRSAAAFTEGPIGALLGGPGYGFDDLTIPRFLVGIYGLYFLLAAALMNILLVTRHTRVEEQTGRAELIRANVVGRHAPLTATLLLTVITNALLTVLMFGGLVSADFDAGSSAVFAAGVGAVGLCFAGITAVTVQVTSYSRAAAGLAGAALGAAYVIRAAGDMLQDQGSLLSWFSPLAWSQQTAPFVLDRWWPLGISLAFSALAFAAGYVLSVRRDLAGSLAGARPGAARAAPWLSSPLALAFRLHRASIIGWSAGMAAGGAVYGALAGPMMDSFEDITSEELFAVLGGGADDLLDGYLGLMGFMMALTVGVFVVLAVQSARAEETRGRAEPVLSTGVGRIAWLGTHLLVTGVAALWLLAVAGLATGVAAALGANDSGLVGEVLLGHVAHTPAVLVVMAIAAVLFAAAPGAIGVTWVVLLHAMIVGFFGPLMELPRWVEDVSPLLHIPQLPAAPLTLAPIASLTVITAAGIAAALVVFRRRDLQGP